MTQGAARTVLIVDDSEDLRELIGELLLQEGYVAEYAATGSEALDRLAAQPAPGLILLDFSLPDMVATDVLVLLRADPSLARIPVVLMSGWGDTTEIAAKEGVGVLVKPVELDELLKVVQKHCPLETASDVPKSPRKRSR